MSKDNVKQMFGKIEKDASLKGKYVQLMQAHQKDAENKMTEKLIEFGKTSGFAFSKEDLMAARAELMDKNNSNKELSEGDLTNVAGGTSDLKVSIVMSSIVTFGISCAAVSAITEIQASGSCGKNMSTTTQC